MFDYLSKPENRSGQFKNIFNSILVILFAVSVFSTANASAAVWSATNSWNASWEDRYHSWVKTDWSRTIFSDRSSKFYGLRPDCADTVYAMRLIFAYQNALPFEVTDPSSTNRRITHEISRFDDKPANERPKAFLKYLFGILSTRSLPNDSYPVAVNRREFRAGIFGLAVKANHHSWTVKDISRYGVPTFYYSTVGNSGASVVTLKEKNAWYNPSWVFEGAISGGLPVASSHAGYRAFKWPSELGSPALLVSRSSMEQYQIPVKKWVERVQERIGQASESSEQRLARLLEDSCVNFKERVDAVNEAWNYVSRQGGRCLSQDEFYQFSTPSRDRRSLEELVELRKQYQQSLSQGGRLSGEVAQVLKLMFPRPDRSFESETSRMSSELSSNYCRINWGEGRVSLPEIRRRLARGYMSNNPLDEPARRWGEDRGSSSLAQSCSDFDDNWSPELSSY